MEYTTIVTVSSGRSRRAQVARAVRRVRDGRRADVRGQRRPDHLRRSHQARAGVPRNVAAAAPSAGPRSVSGRHLLPALASAWNAPRSSPTNSAAVRSPRCRSSKRRPATSSAYIPTNVISITDGQIYLHAAAVLPGHPAGGRRRYLGVARRRFGADQGDEDGRRPAQARPRAVPRTRGVRQALERPRQEHAEAARRAARRSPRSSSSRSTSRKRSKIKSR